MHTAYNNTHNTCKNESKHSEMGPVRQNPIQRTVSLFMNMCVHRTVYNCCTQYCTEQTWQFSPLPSRRSPQLRWCLFEGRGALKIGTVVTCGYEITGDHACDGQNRRWQRQLQREVRCRHRIRPQPRQQSWRVRWLSMFSRSVMYKITRKLLNVLCAIRSSRRTVKLIQQDV